MLGFFRELRELIELNDYINHKFDLLNEKNYGDHFINQNCLSAFMSGRNEKVKILDDTWNWIAPDISQEYNKFMGPMVPNIYHFCGTNLAKKRLETYDRWK